MLLSLLIFFFGSPSPKEITKPIKLSSVISNFVYTTELNMILKQRTGLEDQTGKCNKGNPQITEDIWPDSSSAKPDLLLVAYCKLNKWTKCSAVNKMWEKEPILVWDVLTGILHVTWGRDICFPWDFWAFSWRLKDMDEILSFTLSDRHTKMREIWMERNKNEKFGRSNLWGKVEEIRLFCSRKKQAEENHSNKYWVCKRCYKEDSDFFVSVFSEARTRSNQL